MMRPYLLERTPVEEDTVAVKKSRAASHSARKTGEEYRSLQKSAEAKRPKSGSNGKEKKGTQAGAQRYPEPPLPKQHLAKPGLESEMDPRPHYLAPAYKGSGKLERKVARSPSRRR